MLKTSAVFLVGLLLGVGGTVAYHFHFDSLPVSASGVGPALDSNTGSQPERAALSASARSGVVALGTLEPRLGIVNVASALIGHRIARISEKVQEGKPVKQGEILIELDGAVDKAELQLALLQTADARQRQATEIELAKQRLAAAQMAQSQLKAASPLELDLQQAKLAVLAAKLKQCEADLRRVKHLHGLPEPLASDQQVEQQSVLVEVARTEKVAGDVGLKKFSQSLEFQVQTADAEKQAAELGLRLAQSNAGIQSLEEKVELQKIKLAQVQVVAPISGTVLKVAAHEGELVGQSPLLQIADLKQLVCLVEVDAADVQYLRIGQKAMVYSRAFRGEYRKVHAAGIIERFGTVVASAGLQPLDPRAPVDRHVVKAEVAVNATDFLDLIFADEKVDSAALVGLQVEVGFPKQADSPAIPSS